jgi:hypothetical protein
MEHMEHNEMSDASEEVLATQREHAELADERYEALVADRDEWRRQHEIALEEKLEWKAEVDRLRLRADTDAKAKAAWEKLFNERNWLWRVEADRVEAVRLLLEANGCDCDCEHDDTEGHNDDCERCLACRISWAL